MSINVTQKLKPSHELKLLPWRGCERQWQDWTKQVLLHQKDLSQTKISKADWSFMMTWPRYMKKTSKTEDCRCCGRPSCAADKSSGSELIGTPIDSHLCPENCAAKKPNLWLGNKVKRLKYAWEHRKWGVEMAAGALGSMFDVSRRQFVGWLAGERYNNECNSIREVWEKCIC